MSSTEPPSRLPPRGQAHDSKAAREELSSKGKVEKVREVDADEEARKKNKFLKFYKGIDEEEGSARPSPFDLYSGKQMEMEGPGSFKDAENAIVPGPDYAPPPNVSQFTGQVEEEEGSESALPKSADFWDDFDADQPKSQENNYRETPGLSDKKEKSSISGHKKRVQEIAKKEKEAMLVEGKIDKKVEHHERQEKKKKVEEPSPFGPPGKPHEKRQVAAPARPEKKGERKLPKEEEKKKIPSPFERTPPSTVVRPHAAPMRTTTRPHEEHARKEKREMAVPEGIGPAIPTKSEEREGGEKRDQKKEEKILQIESPSLQQVPSHLETIATAATAQAAPYLTQNAVSLFYQMVGTMYVMSGPQGVSRTDVVLNNPNFQNSKFFGATITIEKYATAPDSFNIRLTGPQDAVISFRENIPSLLAAFQNGKFSFRIGRIDAEYTIEKPIFRRKEKGEGKGEAGEEDLRDRR